MLKLTLFVSLCHLFLVYTFQSVSNVRKSLLSIRMTPRVLHMQVEGAKGALAIIKKKKLKEAKQYQDRLDQKNVGDEEVLRYLSFKDSKTLDEYVGGEHVDLVDSLRDRYRTINVMAEYNKKSKTGFVLGIPGPEIMGGVLRDAGCKAIIVSMDSRTGGVSDSEFARFSREQMRAKNLEPGPIALVWHEFIVDNTQIYRAASCGAAGVTFFPELLEEGQLRKQISLCKDLGMEAVVMVQNIDGVNTALANGARVLIVHGIEHKEQIEMRGKFPSTRDGAYADVVWGAKLRASSEFSGVEEIDASWALRDGGYNFVWPTMDALYCMAMEDVYPTVIAIKAKASKEFISPRQFLMNRKKEGAKEYLGELSI
jgi:indole-3-glycerol phosphate synthase